MKTTQVRLVDALHFTGAKHYERSIATVVDTQGHLSKGDVVHFPVDGVLTPLFVEARISNSVQFGRITEYKYRHLGGAAIRKWVRRNRWVDNEWTEPRPRRAVPLIRRRAHWPEIIVPVGASGIVLYQAYIEGAS